MFKILALLLCAASTAWLVQTFGYGMLITVGALVAAALLLGGGRVREPDAGGAKRVTKHHSTGWTDF